MTALLSRKRSSSLALAIALATGAAVVSTAVIPAEASAQRSSKKDRERNSNKKEEESTGGGYTDAFRAAYVPLNEALNAEGADVAALRPQVDALMPLLTTSDEKLAGGTLIYNAGVKLQDRALQLQGLKQTLASGLIPAESLGQYNFIAYQISDEADDTNNARTYLQAAIDNNFTTSTIDRGTLQVALAETYFAQNQLEQGYTQLEKAISEQKATGQPVKEQWYRRGVSVAYSNKSVPQVYEFTTMWLSDYPTRDNWREAINLTRNLNSFENAEILDLFRLSRKVGTLTEAGDYDYYVEAADPRRLPQEVKEVIDEGKASGAITSGNLFITEALETANSRVAADRADIPALERDAMAAGAPLRTVLAAGNALLSYGDYAKAETLFEKTLTLPGVDTNEALTRLGIAQVGGGDYTTARQTFEKVGGTRAPIATLWIAYTNEVSSGGAAQASANQTPATAQTAGS